MLKTSNWIKTIPLLLFILLVILVFSALKRENSDSIPSIYIGKKPPPLNLLTLGDFPQVTLEDLKPSDEKKIILVNFWASWCPPCRVEHPQLEKISLMDDVKIIGVNYKDDEFSAIEFIKKYGNPYNRLGSDPFGRNAIDWGVYGVPETFVLDKMGKILYRHPGPITKTIYKKTIKNLLN